MKKLDIATTIGLVGGVGVIIAGILMGGALKNFIDMGSIFITIFGSFAAVMINFPMDEFKNIGKVIVQCFLEIKVSKSELILKFSQLSRKARREGLLSLEDEVNEVEDEFFKNALQMVIDGVEPESIKEILELEISEMENRHDVGSGMIKAWGGYAPGFGMIGTLIGLINMLVQMDDPSKIASGMAVALITTFYGAFLANLVLNPMGEKLTVKSEKELAIKDMILEGVLSIQSGVNPRIVEQKLTCYLCPAEKKAHYELAGKEEGGVING